MTPTQALKEVRALVASEGYAITALTLANYRSDLLRTIDLYQQQIAHPMTDHALQDKAAAAGPNPDTTIAQLNATIADQQAIMDKAASIIAEGLHSEDGIDEEAGNQCIEAIRDHFKSIEKTTVESMVETLFERIGAAAGFPSGTEFNPLHVIDQMRITIVAQAKIGKYLERALKGIWRPGEGDTPAALTLSEAGAPPDVQYFPPETTWLQALDATAPPVPPENAAPAPSPDAGK
jgi:hypothetical protein